MTAGVVVVTQREARGVALVVAADLPTLRSAAAAHALGETAGTVAEISVPVLPAGEAPVFEIRFNRTAEPWKRSPRKWVEGVETLLNPDAAPPLVAIFGSGPPYSGRTFELLRCFYPFDDEEIVWLAVRWCSP